MHTRIRQFNTRDTYPEQKLDNDLCQAVVARGRNVFVRGQVGQKLDTSENVGVGDPVAQTEQAMANVAQLLKEAGGELAHICKVTIYLTDPRYREGGLPNHRTVAQRRISGFHRAGGFSAGTTRVAGGSGCDRGDPR